MTSPTGWSWRVADPAANEGLNLLYEPGNWGDVLKGAWAIAAARAVIASRGLTSLEVLDPYAGAPTYPLVEAAADRIAALPPLQLSGLQAPFVRDGRFASTALLVVETARAAGVETSLRVFDTDDVRRERWRGAPGVTILELETGDAALGRSADLLLVDPYDLWERAEAILPPTLPAGGHQPVLYYLFNKAPRGANQLKRYQELRRLLEQNLGARQLLVGRIPSDAVLPRSYHEMWLVGPKPVIDSARLDAHEATRTLARHLAEAGCCE